MIHLEPPAVPWHRRARRWLARRRRLAAAALATLAVWSSGTAVVSALRPATVPVVVATRDLPSGTRVAADDVRTVDWPVDLAPDGTVEQPEGAVVRSALTRGEPLTRARVRGATADLDRPGVAGRVTVLAGLADAWSAHLVEPGTTVDVYVPTPTWDAVGAAAASPPAATRVAGGAVVVDVVTSGGTPAGPALGPPDGWASEPGLGTPSAAALVLAVRPAEAPRLASAAGTGVAVTVPMPDEAAPSPASGHEQVR